MRRALGAVVGAVVVCASVSACLERPVASTEPHTSNLNIDQIENQVVDKLDLLFMIDNSRSMADKQALLAEAVPKLVERLVVPRCVNASGDVQRRTALDEACPSGYRPEFRAANDIHVAVVSSSLGAHGALGKRTCEDTPPENDRAWLLPKVRTAQSLPDYAGTGFLAWDPRQRLTPPGERDATRFGASFGALVQAAGEDGCGYEASLESWYRFLVDPEPPQRVELDASGRGVPSGVDQELLTQRHAFLRPDSLVAIVMLTDENDCSIRDDAFGNWLANPEHGLPRATSACERDPNDACCLPCNLQGAPPAGCPAPAQDPGCSAGAEVPGAELQANLRCFENKRRFGYDFLYPTSRYVQALTALELPRRSDGQLVPNPLFEAAPGHAPRSRDLVFLAGIIGVPWQDIADEASRSGAGLRYLSASELEATQRWDVILGDAAKNLPPSDPFMVESTPPRRGANPITGDPIAPETSTDPHANAINGHEQVDVDGSDLQYACTFALGMPEACSGDSSCDCHAGNAGEASNELLRNRPLCQPPGGGAAEPTQYFGKAYPGLRPLEVLRGIGDSAIVASICPKVLGVGQPGYGYEPAVDAIIDHLKVALSARCLPRPLAVEPGDEGRLPCQVIEAAAPIPGDAGTCSCDATSRRQPATSAASDLVRRQLAARRQCDTATTPSCSSFCMCELAQAEGTGLSECLNDEVGSSTPGYCYVHPYGPSPQGNEQLVAGCDEGSKQLLRFVGPDTPRPGATTFLACLGATVR